MPEPMWSATDGGRGADVGPASAGEHGDASHERDRVLVLIADDDRDIVRFVEVNLRLEGIQVVTAHDGRDALAKALDLVPDLVLLDVMMPGMDGYEVCANLRADRRCEGIPVIMLTAKSLEMDKGLAHSAGADDYITKPFEPMELIERVKVALDRAGGHG